MLTVVLTVLVIVVKKVLGKKDTILWSSIIAFVCIVETMSIGFQLFITREYK